MALIEIYVRVADTNGHPIVGATVGGCSLEDLSNINTMENVLFLGATNGFGTFASYIHYNDDRELFYRVRYRDHVPFESVGKVGLLHGGLYQMNEYVTLPIDIFDSTSIPEITKASIGSIVWI